VVPCNLCGSRDTRPFLASVRRGLVQCVACDLVYVGRLPEQAALDALYDEAYFQKQAAPAAAAAEQVGYAEYAKDEPTIRRTARRRLDHLARFVARGRLLDVGCALGFFLDEAHRRGWEVTGLDVSPFAARHVRERFGHPAHEGGLLDAPLAPGSFDLVTMYDVIEHVRDPKAHVEAVRRLLGPGGVFECSTPDKDSLGARVTGRRWIGYNVSEEHVFYFSSRTLRRMLEEAGFEVLATRHVGKDVSLKLFQERLAFYAPRLARAIAYATRAFQQKGATFYVNPFDTVALTARRRP
jgi:SAM-dependent methyltransferase